MGLKKIINSGAYGAEQGALSAAFAKNCPTGGSISKGYETTRGPLPSLKLFNLNEIEVENKSDAMIANIKESDGTLLFVKSIEDMTRQEKFIKDYCDRSAKTVIIMSLENPLKPTALNIFVEDNKIQVLHVTGGIDNEGEDELFKGAIEYMKEALDDIIDRSKYDRSLDNFSRGQGVVGSTGKST